MRLIAVVLGEPDSNTRFAETRKLLDYGFANFELSEVNKKGEEIGTIDVKKGLKMTVKAVYPEDVKILLSRGEKGNIERKIIPEEEIMAPVKKGQKVGEVIYTIGENEVKRVEIVAQEDVDRATFVKLFFRLIGHWFALGRK